MANLKHMINILKENSPAAGDTPETLRFKMLRGHIQWTASMGDSRGTFIVKFILGLILTPVSIWIAYFTPLSEQLEQLSGLASAFWETFYFVSVFFPFAMLLLTLVAVSTGMFSKDFWRCVEISRMQHDKTDHSVNKKDEA